MRNRLFLLILSVLVIAGVFFLFTKMNKGITKTIGSGEARKIFNLANANEQKGDLLAARDSYERIIKEFPSSAFVSEAQKKIEDLNIRLLFSETITPGSQLYEIESGDTLVKIAKKFSTTISLISKTNGLVNNNITAGKKIKVWTVPFSIVVDKSENVLFLKSGEEVFKTYVVSTGKNNCTPVGTFKIVTKQENPVWYKDNVPIPAESPENILGTRWLGFDNPGYGIHGTTDPQSIGKQTTQGCVRMANKDVEELYSVVPIGTEVTIVE